MNPKLDIDHLAREADVALATAERDRALARSHAAGRRRRIRLAFVAALPVLPLIVFQAHFAWIDSLADRVFPVRADLRRQADMKVVLESARVVIEAARAGQGVLPQALPSAALAALVQYERVGPSYRLSMSDGYAFATMDGDGRVDFQSVAP